MPTRSSVGNAAGNGFAVVELFTSEGCSSCPPADALLAEIVESSRQKNDRIFPIAFHVDYWNRLGWRDPFSSAEASARQQRYANAFKSEQVYTPQMIVNGSVEFVGSDRARATRALPEALSHDAGVTLSIHVQKIQADQMMIDFELDHQMDGSFLNFVVVERGLITNVARGENRGRTLVHDNVARSFKSIPIEHLTGQVMINFPETINKEKSSVVAFVQIGNSMQIVGAAAMDLKGH